MTKHNEPKAAVDTGEHCATDNATSGQRHRLLGYERIRKRLLEPLAISRNPPWVDARGVAIGLFVALGLPVGAHSITLAALRAAVKYNIVIAFALTWIINPLTVIPIYYAYYYMGALILGGPPPMGVEGFRQAMQPILHAAHFGEALKEFVHLDLEILIRWAIPALTIGSIASVAGYFITYRIQCHRRSSTGASSIGATLRDETQPLEANKGERK